jgi:Flp pilus assembly protein TadG
MEQGLQMTPLQLAAEHRPHPQRSRQRGQGLVEFALIAPLMIFMLLITVDFARAYSAHIQVTNAARAGAIYGSRSMALATDSTAVQDAALADSPTIYSTAPVVSSSTSKDSDDYDQISVTVNYNFSTLFNYPGIPTNVTISRTVSMRVIG